MRLLAIDTSTAVGGVALTDGERLVAEYTLNLQRSTHSERLMPAVARVLADAGWSRATLAGIAVALGPGSFTGLRIGVATAKALAFAWDLPVTGVGTLAALAWQATGLADRICPLLDARHGEVYTAVYRPAAAPAGLAWPQEVVAPAPMPLEELAALLRDQPGPVAVVGDGLHPAWTRLAQVLGERIRRPPAGFELLRSASVAMLGMLRLRDGRADDVDGLRPLYLKKSEAERRWLRK